jgi:hypothetical protein
MKDQFKDLLAPDGLLSRLLYIVLFSVIFYLCIFILLALVIFQFLHLVLTGEKNDKVTDFAGDFSKYMGSISAYVSLASERKPFPFQDWKEDTMPAAEDSAGKTTPPKSEKPVTPKVKPQIKATGKKTAAKKKVAKKSTKKTAKKSAQKK